MTSVGSWQPIVGEAVISGGIQSISVRLVVLKPATQPATSFQAALRRRTRPGEGAMKRALLALALALVAAAAACSRPGGPATSDEFGGRSVGFPGGLCLPVTSNERLQARYEVTSATNGSSSGDIFFTSELFGRLNSYCGACHDAGQNGFSSKNQDQDWTKVFGRIQSDDPDSPGGFMPPVSAGGKAWSARAADPNDPIVELVRLMKLWHAQGQPRGSFSLTQDGGSGGVAVAPAPAVDAAIDSPDGNASAPDPTPGDEEVDTPAPAPIDAGGPESAPPAGSQGNYAMTPEQGAELTNIGTCVPNKYSVAVDTGPMDKLDTFFASANALPVTLDETDLVTFDSEALARRGVISYFPAWKPALVGQRRQDAPRAHAARPAHRLRRAGAEVPHPPEHALLQDVLQVGRRRERAASLEAHRDPSHRVAPRRDAH